MFRTDERRYNLSVIKNNHQQKKVIEDSNIIFPDTIDISYATCSSNECYYGENVVYKEKVICQYCMNQMKLDEKETYKLNYETFQCPICETNSLYFPPYMNDGIGSYEECPNCKFQFTYYDEKEIEKAQKIYKNISRK